LGIENWLSVIEESASSCFNLAGARAAAYAVVEKIHFEDAHYRRDIATRALPEDGIPSP